MWDIDTPKIENIGHQMINYIKKQNKLCVIKNAKRKLTFFGHVCCLPETTPVKIALRYALRPLKKPRGEILSNIRGRSDRSKRHRKVASNRPGPKFFSG